MKEPPNLGNVYSEVLERVIRIGSRSGFEDYKKIADAAAAALARLAYLEPEAAALRQIIADATENDPTCTGLRLAYEKGRREEREACARQLELKAANGGVPLLTSGLTSRVDWRGTLIEEAQTIRARDVSPKEERAEGGPNRKE